MSSRVDPHGDVVALAVLCLLLSGGFMSWFDRVFALAVVAVLTACGGQTLGGNDSGPPRNGPPPDFFDAGFPAPSGTDAGASDAAPAPDGSHEGCGYPPGALHPEATAADFRKIFSRQWLSCGSPNLSDSADEAGFEAHEDGTYDILSFDANHSLVPNGSSGTYEIVANAPGIWQVNFHPAASSLYKIVVAKLTDAPRMLDMDNNGVYEYRYVPVDTSGWPELSGPQPGALGTWTPPAACAQTPTQTLSPASPDEFATQVVGTWLQCSSTGVGPDSPAEAGVRIDANGRYEVLEVDASGMLVAATDLKDTGTWKVGSYAPPVYELSFFRDDGANMNENTTLEDAPREMVFHNDPAKPTVFVAAK